MERSIGLSYQGPLLGEHGGSPVGAGNPLCIVLAHILDVLQRRRLSMWIALLHKQLPLLWLPFCFAYVYSRVCV